MKSEESVFSPPSLVRFYLYTITLTLSRFIILRSEKLFVRIVDQ